MPDFVFNYSSATPEFEDSKDVLPVLAEMLKAMANLEDDFPEKPVFRMRDNPWKIEVAAVPGSKLTLGEAVELLFRHNYESQGTYFYSLALMSPSWDELDESVVDTIAELGDIKEDPLLPGTHLLAIEAEEEGLVCGVTGSVLTSLLRRPVHQSSQVGFMCNGESFKFHHVSSVLTGAEISKRIKDDIFTQLTSKTFSDLKVELFPDLLFGQEVDGLVKTFPSNFLSLLFSRFKDLDSVSRYWNRNGAMPENCMEFKPESDFTMNKYGGQRNRKGYDGEQRTFELHVWVGCGTRIHLFKHDDLRKIEIGYVGPHLDTKLH
ncbi:hypothetical protein [Pseudomonas viridiflava]|uniref:hypothetical protein n=1 Tax=Pseudomonas viridiflava TaxID=33069 RepID=UPI000F0283BC|nr:hypothetical protein [Pseudomonas viridiflava]